MSFSQEKYSIYNRHDIKEEICDDVIQYQHLKTDGSPDLCYSSKRKIGTRESTKMECLLNVMKSLRHIIYSKPELMMQPLFPRKRLLGVTLLCLFVLSILACEEEMQDCNLS